MGAIRFRATEDQVLQLGSNAVNASYGGFFWPADNKSAITVTRETTAHDSGLGSKALTKDGLHLDYVAGRMVKLHVRRVGDGLWEMNWGPRGDYQSWCRKYPTNEALIRSVPGIEILPDAKPEGH